MSIILLIIYILSSAFLIRTLVRCFKNKEKWWKLFIYEIIAISISAFLGLYFDSLPGGGFMPGFDYMGEVLISYAATIIFVIITAITVVSKTIIFLQEKKKQDKKYFSRINLAISIILFIIGTFFLIDDIKNDINVKKIDATIIGYTENEYGYERPIVQYRVDGEMYEVMIEVLTTEIKSSGLNDKVTIHYDKRYPSQLGYLSFYEIFYLPCFLVSIILFIVARKNRDLG